MMRDALSPRFSTRYAKGLTLAGLMVASLSPCQRSIAESISEAPLSGIYFLGGKTLVDVPPEEARDTHLYMELTGAAARALYARMQTRPLEDPCGDPGDTLKTMGHIQCARAARGRDYRCWMGIDLDGQRVVNGRVC